MGAVPSVDSLEGQHHALEPEVSCNRKPVEVAGGSHGKRGHSDRRLDQELRCVLCEERPDPVDFVEENFCRIGPQQ